jgi:uncharacterized protein YeaO (DUF488 family)
MIELKRVYDPVAAEDGVRILVDRLWPRGVSKAEASIDEWDREVAPSPELRRWFHEDTQKRFNQFAQRYREELAINEAAAKLKQRAKSETITLVYAAKDPVGNHAIVLKDFLEAS